MYSRTRSGNSEKEVRRSNWRFMSFHML